MEKTEYQILLLEREDTIRLLHEFEFGCAETKQEQIDRLRVYRDNLKKLSSLCERICDLDDEAYKIQGGMYKYDGESQILRRKGEVKNFLNEKSVRLAKYWNYATIAPDGSYYWMNPREEAVNNNWSIVLNDTFNRCLTVFFIPGETFAFDEDEHGFVRRSDKPQYLDMKILADSYIESVSHNNLSKYIEAAIHY